MKVSQYYTKKLSEIRWGRSENILNIKVTIGEMIHIIKQLSKYLRKEYKKLVKRIRRAEARHTDEISWRINEKDTCRYLLQV